MIFQKIVDQKGTRGLLVFMWQCFTTVTKRLQSSKDASFKIQMNKKNFDVLLNNFPEHFRRANSDYYFWGQKIDIEDIESGNLIRFCKNDAVSSPFMVVTPASPIYVESLADLNSKQETAFRAFLKQQALRDVSDERFKTLYEKLKEKSNSNSNVGEESVEQLMNALLGIFNDISSNKKVKDPDKNADYKTAKEIAISIFPKNLVDQLEASGKRLKDKLQSTGTDLLNQFKQEGTSVLEELKKLDIDGILDYLLKDLDAILDQFDGDLDELIRVLEEKFPEHFKTNNQDNLSEKETFEQKNNKSSIKAYAESMIPIAIKHVVYGFDVLEHKSTLLITVQSSEDELYLISDVKVGEVKFTSHGRDVQELVNNINKNLISNYKMLSIINASKDIQSVGLTDPVAQRKLQQEIFINEQFLSQFKVIYLT